MSDIARRLRSHVARPDSFVDEVLTGELLEGANEIEHGSWMTNLTAKIAAARKLL